MFERPSQPDIETDIVIIGAGVAGLTLAEKLLGTEIDFWILGSPFESQLAKAGELEDCSLPEGTVGLKHIEAYYEKLKNEGMNHKSSLCTSVENTEEGFRVHTRYQKFNCKRIVIATGCKQTKLGFEGEKEYFHKGISDCSVCDFPLYRERPVAVIGNHKYTKRAAEFLRKHTSTVSLLWYQKDDIPAVRDVDTYNNVDKVVVSGDEVVQSISFVSDGKPHQIQIAALFVEGTPEPNTAYLEGFKLDLTDGYVRVSENYETSVPQVYAVGDIIGKERGYDAAKEYANDLAAFLYN